MDRIPVPMQPHSAGECRGPIIIDPTTHRRFVEFDEACQRVWAEMSAQDKMNFHLASCLNQVTPRTQATVKRVADALRAHGVP